jgi:hypothetical protein
MSFFFDQKSAYCQNTRRINCYKKDTHPVKKTIKRVGYFPNFSYIEKTKFKKL